MFQRNNGLIKDNALKNRFTAYLKQSVHNRRIDYLYRQSRWCSIEQSINNIEYLSYKDEDLIAFYVESDALKRALQEIKERARYILLARVIEKKSFNQIAAEVGLGYKGTTSAYYRTLKNWRRRQTNFETLLILAKENCEQAMENLLVMYMPLLIKEAVVNGILDKDLLQELHIVFIQCPYLTHIV